MKKICFSLLVAGIFLLMVDTSFAQVSRGHTSSEGKTNFTNISVVGLDRNGTDDTRDTGTPSYIEMVSCAGSTYYLYIGYDGQLRLASDIVVGYLASPATVGWSDASGPLVGNQTN